MTTITCPRCQGRGYLPYPIYKLTGELWIKDWTCPDCDGTGQMDDMDDSPSVVDTL